jgi:hypothetical protein
VRQRKSFGSTLPIEAKTASVLIKAQGYVASAAAARRSERINQLLPLVSQMRHSQNPEALRAAQALQDALADLELLNDVEMLLARRHDALNRAENVLKGLVDAFTRQ